MKKPAITVLVPVEVSRQVLEDLTRLWGTGLYGFTLEGTAAELLRSAVRAELLKRETPSTAKRRP